jgi:hypothetical protein
MATATVATAPASVPAIAATGGVILATVVAIYTQLEPARVHRGLAVRLFQAFVLPADAGFHDLSSHNLPKQDAPALPVRQYDKTNAHARQVI